MLRLKKIILGAVYFLAFFVAFWSFWTAVMALGISLIVMCDDNDYQYAILHFEMMSFYAKICLAALLTLKLVNNLRRRLFEDKAEDKESLGGPDN